MAPKAKKMAAAREVIPDRKMGAPKAVPAAKGKQVQEDKKTLEAREKAQKILALRAVRKIQRHCRLVRVTESMHAINMLEDTVFVVPMPGVESLASILAGPVEELAEDNDAVPSGTASMVGPTSASGVTPPGTHPGTRHSSRPGSAGAVGFGGDPPSDDCRPSSRGSQEGSTASSEWTGLGSKDSDADSEEENLPHISEHTLAHQLKKWDVEDAPRKASLIFWILGRRGDYLYEADLERVYRHHRIRRRNANSKIHLYLALIQHGDAASVFSTRPSTAGPLPCDGPRPMEPEGWEQVTRIAWALRLCPTWSPPGLILTASSQCCTDTAERLHHVLENPENQELWELEGNLQHHHPPHRQESHGHHSRQPSHHHHDHHDHHHHHNHHHHHHHLDQRKCAAPTICDALDFPRSVALLGPVAYHVFEGLTSTMQASENPNRNPKRKPKQATPCFVIAGGAVLETLLGCLTASRPYEEMITARLRGGDAVLLSSAPMCSISGEETDERWLDNSRVWEEALKRDDWKMVKHLRGDGTGQPIELGGMPKIKPEGPSHFKTDLSAQWTKYAGAPLILSDEQFMEIRNRAGFAHDTGKGLDPALTAKLKPLVKDYVIPPDEILEEDSQDNALGRQESKRHAGHHGNKGGARQNTAPRGLAAHAVSATRGPR